MLKEKGVKGQVTIFVVLGVVLLSVFGFALLARGALVGAKLDQEAKNLISDFLQENSINYYVQGCLERVTINALQTIGEQGGNYNSPQGLVYTQAGETYPVHHALLPNTQCTSVIEEPPFYPAEKTYLQEIRGNYPCAGSKLLSGYFGYNRLPKLCYYQGANDPLVVPLTQLACESYAYTSQKEKSIQGQLEEEISNNMRECVDFEVYEKLGNNITLFEENIQTTLIYGIEKITVITHFPFSVQVSGNQLVFTKYDFTYEKSIRLKKMYSYLAKLLAEEAQNYSFNIAQDYANVLYYDQGFNVTFIENASLGPDNTEDDLLQVRDTRSLLDNTPYLFQVAIENRRPALDYIHATGIAEYDVIGVEDEKLYLHPDGYDPDNTELYYNYTGWRETKNDTFTTFDECDATEPKDPEDFEKCITREDYPNEDEGRNWTRSTLYKTTQQNASIELSHKDIGPHTVNVSIREKNDEKLYDWQEVSVIVIDLPEAKFTGRTLPGIKENYGAIEEPYYLDASGSRASVIGSQLTGDTEVGPYFWSIQDKDHNNELLTSGVLSAGEAKSTLPNTWEDVAGMLNYKNYLFKQLIIHNVSLIVEAGGIESHPYSVLVDVKECLPYRNSPSQFTFPYNTDGDFDRTCCAGSISSEGEVIGGTVIPESAQVECYKNTDYGGLLALDKTSYFGTPSITTNNMQITPSTLIYSKVAASNSKKNDVYKREYVRLCDGTRGNVCQGAIQEERTLLLECKDFMTPTQTERCQGPQNPTSASETQPTSCRNYGVGQTFEKIYGIKDKNGNSATGQCDQTPRCSSASTYADGGTYQIAKGNCGGGECTTPSTIAICNAPNIKRCDGTEYKIFSQGCVESSGKSPECTYDSGTVQWNTCSTVTKLGASYCSNSGENTLQTCGPNTCCNPTNPTNPCYDPCQTIIDQGYASCIRERDCSLTGGACSIYHSDDPGHSSCPDP